VVNCEASSGLQVIQSVQEKTLKWVGKATFEELFPDWPGLIQNLDIKINKGKSL
jgi:hypothetical protein